MKKIVSALMAGLMGAPAVALAEDSPHTFSGNVTLSSDYLFRGISQTGGDAAIQGGLDYSHASGFYLGTWASNVGWIEDFQGYKSGNMEIDLYGGYRGELGPVSYDVGVIGYFYPGDNGGATTGDTTELYIGLGWKWFSAKYAYSISDETFGFANSDGSNYFEINASYPVGETGLTLGAHWGTFSFKNNGAQDYDDWKVSAAYDMGKLSPVMSGVTLGVAYSDSNAGKSAWTDANGRYLGDSTTFVWIGKAL
ncbi:MAG: TorF family putative porin [Thiobacillus sp.]|nr:TorF family putative porin [Thiobacillus sp.]